MNDFIKCVADFSEEEKTFKFCFKDELDHLHFTVAALTNEGSMVLIHDMNTGQEISIPDSFLSVYMEASQLMVDKVIADKELARQKKFYENVKNN